MSLNKHTESKPNKDLQKTYFVGRNCLNQAVLTWPVIQYLDSSWSLRNHLQALEQLTWNTDHAIYLSLHLSKLSENSSVVSEVQETPIYPFSLNLQGGITQWQSTTWKKTSQVWISQYPILTRLIFSLQTSSSHTFLRASKSQKTI